MWQGFALERPEACLKPLAGTFRHADHRFEWSRAEFAAWATAVAARHGYQVRLVGMGRKRRG